MSRVCIKAVRITRDNVFSLVEMYPDRLVSYDWDSITLFNGKENPKRGFIGQYLVMYPSGRLDIVPSELFGNSEKLVQLDDKEYALCMLNGWLSKEDAFGGHLCEQNSVNAETT